MTRSTIVLSLREKVQYSETHSDATHQFQDEVVRPILKFQHSLLLAYFNDFIATHKINLMQLEMNARISKIRSIIKQNAELQHTLRAFIIALFSDDELEFWTANKRAINKRITEMITERILSTTA